MRNEHVDVEELLRFRHGEMSGSEARETADHLAACAVCRAVAAEMFADDPLSLQGERRSTRARQWLAIAATVIVVLIGVSLRLRHSKASYERAEWNTLVSDALARGSVTMPAITIAQPEDQLRGATQAAQIQFTPDATVVESTRPEFAWPEIPHASYVVTIARDGQPVASSGSLQENRWQPLIDLQRGATYEWQVRVTRGDEVSTLPAPPRGHPRFAVLSRTAASDLAAARTTHAHDHLLIGVLAAHYGLKDTARRELAQSQAKELAASVNR